MYKIRKGKLYKGDKAVFGLGVSYYASYHERKVPVPKEGDRIGEMKKDLAGMAEFGFQMVRCAALCDMKYNDKREVEADTGFMDAIMQEAEKDGISVMLRLQGYSMNLSGYEDYLMVDPEGKPMDRTRWYDFIQNCLHHQGIIKDNDACTAALAKHFAEFDSLAGYQTYNEPHYPSVGLYDYHPKTIEEYRKWLVREGIMTAQAAATYDPPGKRPQPQEDKTDWILWRMFAAETLSDFLNHSSAVATAASGKETMTCQTTCPLLYSNAGRGVNYYQIAEKMDAVGVTHYFADTAPEIYLANMHLDMSESAAALYGKPMWIVEYDARTNIPRDKFRRETYMAVGSGCAGILYYQWRGDYVFPDSPEGNGFGLVNYDGSRTENFENAKNVVRLLNRLSDYTVNAGRLRDGVAILYSEWAYLYYDAAENPGMSRTDNVSGLRNSYRDELIEIYRILRTEGYNVDIIRACDLRENVLKEKVLFTPTVKKLSENEKKALAEFEEHGGIVFGGDVADYKHCRGTYQRLDERLTPFRCGYPVYDAIESTGVLPHVTKSESRDLLMETLKGDGYYIVCLTNGTNLKKTFENVRVKTRFPFREATLYTFEEQEGIPLAVRENGFVLDKVEDGGFVLLK